MKRRDFIKHTGVAVSAPLILNGLSVRSLANSSLLNSMYSVASNRVLVVVQMQGGNDGLNMILPIDKYNYLSNTVANGGRAEILIPATSGLKFELNGVDQYAQTRLHPSMGSLASMYAMGKLCVVQGAGYVNQSFSHFRSTDIWMSGSDPNVVQDSGWIGRKLDADYPNYSTNLPAHPLALNIGSVSPNIFMGGDYNMGVAVQNPSAAGTLSSINVDVAPNSIYGYELDYSRSVLQQTNSFFSAIQGAYNGGTNISAYPNTSFAQQLKTVARLLNGGLQTRFFMVNIGGFDTHDGQVNASDTRIGWHADLMKNLSDGIAAFQNDISQLTDSYGFIEDRVVGMTFSEFGRTIKANTTYGTDHGTSAPLLLFGQDINPIVLGSNPEVYDTANAKMKSDLDVQFDFRSVYASLLHQWLDVPVADVNILLGKTFNNGSTPGQNIYDGGLHCNLPILKPAGNYSPTTGINQNEAQEGVSVYPNPTNGTLTLSVNSAGEEMELFIFNTIGQQVRHTGKQMYAAGKQQLEVDLTGLGAGNYTYWLSGQSINQKGNLVVQ